MFLASGALYENAKDEMKTGNLGEKRKIKPQKRKLPDEQLEMQFTILNSHTILVSFLFSLLSMEQVQASRHTNFVATSRMGSLYNYLHIPCSSCVALYEMRSNLFHLKSYISTIVK
jgi:hypothetical protein